jgi:hypothetical protein
MFGVCSLNLHKVISGLAMYRYVTEPYIPYESGYPLTHILVHYWTEADKLLLALTVNPDILDRDVFQSHILTRLKKE